MQLGGCTLTPLLVFLDRVECEIGALDRLELKVVVHNVKPCMQVLLTDLHSLRLSAGPASPASWHLSRMGSHTFAGMVVPAAVHFE